MNSNIRCTLEEYEEYIKPINENINKISLILLVILFTTIVIFDRNSYVNNIVISLLIVSLNIDIKTTQKNIKKSLESNYILIDEEMIIYYTNIFKLGKKLNKTYCINKINEII